MAVIWWECRGVDAVLVELAELAGGCGDRLLGGFVGQGRGGQGAGGYGSSCGGAGALKEAAAVKGCARAHRRSFLTTFRWVCGGAQDAPGVAR